MEEEGDALVDPLANYWGISLFTSPSLPPSQPYNSDLDLHTIHSHLKSMALRSPAKLVQEAKLALDDDPNLFDSEIFRDSISQTTSISQKTNDAGEDGEFRREQRPGLGLKRPRFSMKPTKKPSVESLLPTLDLDSLKDPAEFFLAHERLENAKREIQKQLGGASFESDQDSLSTRPRQRRPGLLRNDQLPIRYKHRYPRETSESVLSSQDALGSQTLDPLAEKIDVDEAYMISSEKEVMDSSAIKGNEFDELLDGLLSCNSEDLEGDGAISLLQERLQIKPVAVDKFSFPIFPDSQVTDLKSLQRNKSLQGNKSKPRKALSDIDNLLKGIITNKKTPLKKSEQFTVQQLSSPTPPRSPFASILSLQKHISRSRQSLDSFSLDEISMDNSEPNLVSGRPNEMNTRMIEHVVAVADQSDPAGYQASAVDKRASRSEDDQSNPTEYQAYIVQEKTDDSMEPVKNQKKRVKSRAKKNVSKRKSLADSGTSWNDGLRRSTRIRTRPLEYWKGERPVYGRVHQSLATVIGVKCMSPGTDGKPTMKVKSYVSDLHKELFELASLY